jgi:hypothetical protein
LSDALEAKLGAVRERIARAAARAGRRAEHVTLVGVSKRQPAEAVAALVAAGLAHCGENFVQEARDKIPRGARKTMRDNNVTQAQVGQAEARLASSADGKIVLIENGESL